MYDMNRIVDVAKVGQAANVGIGDGLTAYFVNGKSYRSRVLRDNGGLWRHQLLS